MAAQTAKPKAGRAGGKLRSRPEWRLDGRVSADEGEKLASEMAPPAKKPVRKRSAGAKAAGDFAALANEALRRGEPDAIADALLHDVFAAAVKVYAAKTERRGCDVKPFRDGTVTATEAVVAACALIRAADLNLFDVAMWFNRPPAAR